MKTRALGWGGLVVAAAAIAIGQGCGVDTAPTGLRATPPGTGPIIKWDLSHRPLPDVPIPNDIATFADPTSRTGMRINASLIAPSWMEEIARHGFSEMEGWGTSAPITLSFNRGLTGDPHKAAIDLESVRGHMRGDGHDFSDDPVYVINLKTGVPMILDVGEGYYPATVRDPYRYWPNDPKASESNLLFETVEEGAGLTQADYKPSLDRDFDGILDHPNTLGPLLPGQIGGVDDLLTWYERETDTLILRPVLPLEEKTEYAVVITDRLKGYDGQAVRSPFPYVHHPLQRHGAEFARSFMNDTRLANYYGDLAGSGLDHVQFVWTFTTQPTQEDLRLLRNGLYGTGPFKRWQNEYPPDVSIYKAAGRTSDPNDAVPDNDPVCAKRNKTPYVVKVSDDDVTGAFHSFFTDLFNFDPGDTAGLLDQLKHVDHVVIGNYKSPYLLGDPASRDEETRFNVNFKTGEGDIRPDTVTFWLSVPKTTAEHKPPFPVAFYGHGVTSHTDELLVYAGDYARQGIALVMYDNPEHGISLKPGEELVTKAKLNETCLVPWENGINTGRAHDLNGDGVPDSGWFWWTAHVFHVRDNVRQGILDGMQLTRILRSFDGVRHGPQDFNGDGQPELAGDFDGDGTVDVGGPNVKYSAAGESLGGIMSEIQGGIDPYLSQTSPMSGGGALVDVAVRSYGVTEAVTEQMLGPLLVSLPASARPDRNKDGELATLCTGDQRSVRWVVNEGDNSQEMEIACLDAKELLTNFTVVATNVRNHEVRCARTGVEGRFRISLPATKGDKVDIQVYNAPDVVTSYDGCHVLDGAPVGRRVSTWEKASFKQFPVADGDKTHCDGDSGCQQFRDTFFPVGSSLVAPNDGFGFPRQTPHLRRLRDLAQAAVDPGDPINFAPYYMIRPLLDENDKPVEPHGLLSINTVGDAFVSIATGITFARAAGGVPFLPPQALARFPEYADYVTPQALYDQLGGRTPAQVYIDTFLAEGVNRLARTHAGPGCRPNYLDVKTPTCNQTKTVDTEACSKALFDVDWVSEGKSKLDQPHATMPVRLGRIAGLHPTDAISLAHAWEPRLQGVPFAPDAQGWPANQKVVAVLNHYLELKGQHTWDAPDVCRRWDYATYGNGLMARFFASEGKDVYYLSHPTSHGCLVDVSCPFFADSKQ